MHTPSLFTLLFLLPIVSASTNAICGAAYGRPRLVACATLLYSMNDETNRFLGPPQMLRPSGVSDTEWRDRRTLPSVHTVGNCNLAILSILRLNRQYTSAVASFAEVSQKELLPSLAGGRTVFHDCTVKYGNGGFRQVRMVAGIPGLITVIYADGSSFEQFLLSGAGSTHYDAAVENPDGTFNTFWWQHKLSRPGVEDAKGEGEGTLNS